MNNHLTLADIHPDNYRLYFEKPDPNFSVEHNYKVIRRVLTESDRRHAQLEDVLVKNAGNVADILASFAKYKLDIGGGKQIEEWLGKGWMTRIYGERLIEKIRLSEEIRRKNIENGNTLYGGNFYLK